MTDKTLSVALGRARLPKAMAIELQKLPPSLRGRTIATIIQAHVTGMDLQKLVAASDQLRRLGVLLNQSLRVSGGRIADVTALQEAVEKINEIWPCHNK